MDKLEKILRDDAIRVIKKVDLGGLSGKRIIITGASGLIGVNFLTSLKEFSKKTKKKPPFVTAVFHSEIPAYLKDILSFETLDIKTGDIADPYFIETLPEADFIIHAAGYAQPGKFMQDEVKTIGVNTVGTIFLLKKLKTDGKFLFVSTSEVYSGLEKAPHKEHQIGTTTTTHPRASYIEGKRCGEAVCNVYYKKGVAARSARLSLAYGPGTRKGDSRAMNSFIEKALNGKIEMLDRGEAKRTYCYISDAVEIMWDILLFGTKPIYNVGGFSFTSIAGLARKIGKITGAKVVLPKKDEKLSGAPANVWLQMTNVEKEFGKFKKDFVDLDTGLAKTIAWQREIYREK